jgi:hypothetical protein
MGRVVHAFVSLSDSDLAYAAGIIDGEGTIVVTLRTRTERKIRTAFGGTRPYTMHELQAQVKVGNCDLRLAPWLVERFGGHIYHYEPSGNRKPISYWYLRGTQRVRTFLVALLPFLVIKREQAETAIALCDTVGARGRVVPQAQHDERKRLMAELKSLHL